MTVNISGAEAAAAGLSQPFKMTIDGVANIRRRREAPTFDIGVQVRAAARATRRVISTRKRGFVDVDGRVYELPRRR